MSRKPRQKSGAGNSAAPQREARHASAFLSLWLPILSVVVLNLAVYANTLSFSLTNWDDETLISKNALVKELSWTNVERMFSAPYAANYTPLHLLSYAVDYRIWGMNPAGYHLSNVLLHTLSACLLFVLVRMIASSPAAALAVALLFSVHPVQSETVSWVAERKNILCVLFLFGSFISYVRRARGGGTAWGWGAFILFACGLLSKPVAVAYPALLLAYEWCYRKSSPAVCARRVGIYLAAAVLDAAATIWAQRGGGIVSYYGGGFWPSQFTIWPVFLGYLRDLLWPAGLSPVYDVPLRTSLRDPVALVSGLAVFAFAGAAAWAFFKRREEGFWLVWFLASMIPVMELIPINTLKADRYLYFSSIGIWGFLATCAAALWRKRHDAHTRAAGTMESPRLLPFVAALLVAAIPLGIWTARQNQVWRNSMTLWTRALAIAPNNPDTHHHLGSAYLERGDKERAAVEYRRAIELNPDYTKAHINLASIYVGRKDYAEALRLLDEAEARGATAMELFYNKGVCRYEMRDYAAAAGSFQRAMAQNPFFAPVYLMLGNCALMLGDPRTAIRCYEKALDIEPGYSAALTNLKEARRVASGAAQP